MTNRAMIYRPGSRWHIVTAFTAAVVIHLSAVAIASLHREEPTVNPGKDFAIIEADPGEESPAQPQIEIPVQNAASTRISFRVHRAKTASSEEAADYSGPNSEADNDGIRGGSKSFDT